MTEADHIQGLSSEVTAMLYRLSSLALLGALSLGTGVAQAQLQSTGMTPHHTYSYAEWAYFEGKGFATSPEYYAFSGNEPAPAPSPEAANAPKGHQYTVSEYLYFTGLGFSSGAQ